MLKMKKLREVTIFNQTSTRSSIRKRIRIRGKVRNFAEHPVNGREGEREKDKTKGDLKVEAKAPVDAQPASGRTKAASRQFLTGGKICKCARGRPR